MVVPVAQETAQEIRPSEPRRVRGSCTAQDEVVAAASAGMAPVEHEFFRCETGLARGGVKKTRSFSQLVPARRQINIDLDDPRVGSDAKKLEARVARRLIAFEQDRLVHCFGGGFDGGDELEIIFQGVDWRHEDIENAASRLNAHRRTGDPPRAFMAARHPISFVAHLYAAWAL